MNDERNQPDLQHLQLLSTFHYVLAAIVGISSLFPIIHVLMGLAMLSGRLDEGSGAPPDFFGWLFVVMGLVLIVCGMTLAVCALFAARNLARRTSYTFCMVVAALECLFMPLGTVLGVFTIIVLMRPSVRQTFGVPE